ncbi:MAG: peptidase MA family metallohydrolase [bacterium]
MHMLLRWLVLGMFLLSGTSLWALELRDFQTQRAEGLVFHYPPQYEAASRPLREDAPGYLRDLRSELAFDALDGIDVWVVRDVADYFTVHGLENRAPKWAAGLSLSNRSVVIIAMRPAPGAKPDEFETTFHHELVHVALDRAAGGRALPRWFHEGFAVMHADEWSPERSEMLSRAAAQGALMSFGDLTSAFPEHHNSASLAYAQSFHFVREWQTRYGSDVYAKVLSRVRNGEPFHQAFRNVTDDSLMVAEARWLQGLKNASSMWSMFNDGVLIFFGAAILFLVAWWMRRNRNAQKLQSMDTDGSAQWDYDESSYPLPGERTR